MRAVRRVSRYGFVEMAGNGKLKGGGGYFWRNTGKKLRGNYAENRAQNQNQFSA